MKAKIICPQKAVSKYGGGQGGASLNNSVRRTIENIMLFGVDQRSAVFNAFAFCVDRTIVPAK